MKPWQGVLVLACMVALTTLTIVFLVVGWNLVLQ
jgi:hypothetical protein